MSKRVKHVFGNSSEVAHVWASRSLDYGNNGTYNGNMFFEGDTIYSYGHHFPIAKFHKMPNGKEVILFDNSNYSSTTSKHQGDVRWAIPDQYKVIILPSRLWFNYKAGRDYYIDIIKGMLDLSSRAREYAMMYLRNASGYVKTLHDWGKLYRRHPRYIFSKDEKAIAYRAKEQLRNSTKREIAREVKAEAKRQEQLKFLNEECGGDVKAYWRKYGKLPTGYNAYTYLLDTLCHVVGDEVITSRNARVPIEHAKRILPIVKMCHDKNRPLEMSDKHPVRIGYYNVEYISAEGDIKIGCHTIKWQEIELLGIELMPEIFKE